MIKQFKEKINIKLYSSLLFSIALLVSCGGGGGGGGSSGTPGGGGFTLYTIDSAGDVGWDTDIATGPGGTVHISYYDNTNGDLKYAYYNGSSWSTEIVDNSSDVGDYSTSIAVDANGDVHISYYDGSPGTYNLKYATNAGVNAGAGDCYTGSNFNCETVDSTGEVGKYSSIAVKSDGTVVHISYYDASTNENLKYAIKPGVTPGDCASTNFDCVTVDSTGDVGKYSSIALDSNNYVHISYYYYDATTNNENLKYATNSGVTPGSGNCASTSFDCETVDSAGDVGEDSSIAVDSNGAVHISYYEYIDSSHGNLKYAIKPGVTSGDCASASFDCETVDSATNVGLYSSIAVDSSNTVHISYYDLDNENLKYATGTAGAFTPVTVNSTGQVGEYSSIAVESDGTVHISYYRYIDASSGHLKYAVK